jgi:hypothetical protein
MRTEYLFIPNQAWGDLTLVGRTVYAGQSVGRKSDFLPDTDGNVQVLCRDCHREKTREDFGASNAARGHRGRR